MRKAEPPVHPPVKGAWSLLAYIVGDDKGQSSPMDRAAAAEIRAIAAAADLKPMPVSLQVDFDKTPGVFRAVLLETSRVPPQNPEVYDLWNRVELTIGNSDVRIRTAPETNAASPATLSDFIKFSRRKFPDWRPLVFFFGHALGPIGMFFDRARGERKPSTLRLNQLADALGAGADPDERVEIVLFRDCYMNTLEAAYQLRGVSRFMIGTQAGAPIAGRWPWVNLLSALMPSADTADVADALALQMGAYFKSPKNRRGPDDVPYSLIAIESIDGCTDALKAMTEILDASRPDPERCRAYANALEAARCNRADASGDPALVDVVSMCLNLAKLGDLDPIYAPAMQLAASVAQANLPAGPVIRRHHSIDPLYNGISLYYRPVTARDVKHTLLLADGEMRREDEENYRALALNSLTGWARLALDPLDPKRTIAKEIVMTDKPGKTGTKRTAKKAKSKKSKKTKKS